MSTSTLLTTKIESDKVKPAEGMAGRIYTLDEKNAKAIKPELFHGRADQWGEVSKAGSTFHGWAGTEVGKVTNQIPEFGHMHPRQVAKAISNEYSHLAEVAEAKAAGNYVTLKTEQGSLTGIVSRGENNQIKQEGLWIARDTENRIREIGQFKGGEASGAFKQYREDGTPSASAYFKDGIQAGTAYKYNEKGEAIERTEFKDGVAQEAQTVDPVAEKAKKAEYAAQKNAMNSLKIGR
jgi:hypothetical protein